MRGYLGVEVSRLQRGLAICWVICMGLQLWSDEVELHIRKSSRTHYLCVCHSLGLVVLFVMRICLQLLMPRPH